MTKTFSAADVATHNKPNDLYVVVDEDVYDLTTFQDEHPGNYSPPPLFTPIVYAPQRENEADRWNDAQAARRSSPESLAKMLPSNSGNTTMKASSRNSKANYRSDPWIQRRRQSQNPRLSRRRRL